MMRLSILLSVCYAAFTVVRVQDKETTELVTEDWLTAAEIRRSESTAGSCWEHALYLNAQNNLEKAAVTNMTELKNNDNAKKAVGTPTGFGVPKYSMKVLIDRSTEYTSKEMPNLGPPSSSGNVLADYTATGDLKELPGWQHKNSSAMTTQVIQDFVNRALFKRPQCYQFLVFWDHGMGPFGYGSTKDKKSLSLPEIRDTLKAVIKGKKLDILGFDACLMSAFEVAYELQPYANFLLASEETEPGHGWDWKSYKVTEDSGQARSPEGVGKDIIDGYIQHSRQVPRTLQLVDLTKFKTFANAFDSLCQHFTQGLAAGRPNMYQLLSRARQDARVFESAVDSSSQQDLERSHVDLGGFLEYLNHYGGSLCNKPFKQKGNNLCKKAYDLYDSDGDASTLNDGIYSYQGISKQEQLAGYTGMSIFFPERGFSSSERSRTKNKVQAYRNLGFKAQWINLVEAFYDFKPSTEGTILDTNEQTNDPDPPPNPGPRPSPPQPDMKPGDPIPFDGVAPKDVTGMKLYVLDPIAKKRKFVEHRSHDVWVWTRPRILGIIDTKRRKLTSFFETTRGVTLGTSRFWQANVAAIRYRWKDEKGEKLTVDDMANGKNAVVEGGKYPARIVQIGVTYWPTPDCGESDKWKEEIDGTVKGRVKGSYKFVRARSSSFLQGTRKGILSGLVKNDGKLANLEEGSNKTSLWTLAVGNAWWSRIFGDAGYTPLRTFEGSFKFRRQSIICENGRMGSKTCGKIVSRIPKGTACHSWSEITASTPLRVERTPKHGLQQMSDEGHYYKVAIAYEVFESASLGSYQCKDLDIHHCEKTSSCEISRAPWYQRALKSITDLKNNVTQVFQYKFGTPVDD